MSARSTSHTSPAPYVLPAYRVGSRPAGEARGGTRMRASFTRQEESSEDDLMEVSDTDVDLKATKLHAVIALQTFEGFWEWNQDLLHTLDLNPGVVVKEVKEAFDVAAKRNGVTQPINPFYNRDSTAIIATALVLAFLEKEAADRKDVWELIGDKARGWINSTLARTDEWFRTSFNDARLAFNNKLF
ncbi:hypothetical protein VTN77DRAFT_8699 [Rasamsonia byssochlamydoides]|uniref:uncharacterized protein n=1 Tax=Rasamsonia byssochlamydoides TaxID=89139 RepID=UPI0037427643